MTKDEALRMALEALDALCINDYSGYELGKRDAHLVDNALTAIKEALAQPEREWIGLTDEEIDYCVKLKNAEAIVEEVEAKLKQKNGYAEEKNT